MRDLEEILQGQDISLVWRRDGLSCFPVNKHEREGAYRRMASLKTGALFRLLGHLVMEDRSMDETLTQIGYVLPFPGGRKVSISWPFFPPFEKKDHFAKTCDRWCAQVQNDCKNVYSLEYADLKGSLAEDLRNRELNYPIVLALDTPGGKDAERALESPTNRNVRRAMRVIQSRKVRALCAAEMRRSSKGIEEWLQLWNRKEKMNLQE